MDHYKSWAGLKKLLNESLCDTLKKRVTYFLTRYHDVHNSYGRAAILFEGKELVCFSWIEMYYQERDLTPLYQEMPDASYSELKEKMKPTWDANCTYYEMDFLKAVLQFRNLPIQEALESENYIIKVLAIMDRRVGKRTLSTILENEAYKDFPAWVRQFYELRLSQANMI
ncbi:hypothetical protein [Oscillibacter sp.]|uniref:SF0329 family protein n=1 Tax=Oscillibacter sp. TaxID=1945593 RepID=UPI0028A9DB5D|nr:hypothetical protein [Oscillibacter sp.]